MKGGLKVVDLIAKNMNQIWREMESIYRLREVLPLPVIAKLASGRVEPPPQCC